MRTLLGLVHLPFNLPPTTQTGVMVSHDALRMGSAFGTRAVALAVACCVLQSLLPPAETAAPPLHRLRTPPSPAAVLLDSRWGCDGGSALLKVAGAVYSNPEIRRTSGGCTRSTLADGRAVWHWDVLVLHAAHSAHPDQEPSEWELQGAAAHCAAERLGQQQCVHPTPRRFAYMYAGEQV